MSQSGTTYPLDLICTWPDGEQRQVTALTDMGGKTMIVWNEKVDSPDKAVTGFEEWVPTQWLAPLPT